MTVIYESVPASSVITTAVELLNATRVGSVADAKRCEWLYLKNPDGQATIWAAKENDKTVGFSALIPRRFWVNGEQKLACTTADLSVLADYRRRGIASSLRKEARKLVEHGAFDFLYGHPNQKSKGAHSKAGFFEVGPMIRRSRIVNTAQKWEKLIGKTPINTLLSKASNKVLPFVFSVPQKHLETEWLAWFKVDDRFDRLDEASKSQRPIQGIRDSRYLQWRYGLNPFDKFRIVVAHRRGELAGFCVVRPIKDSLEIVDIFPPHDQDAAESLLAAVIDRATLDGLPTVSATWMAGHPIETLLNKFGFLSRGTISTMHAFQTSPLLKELSSPSSWLMTAGDRDI